MFNIFPIRATGIVQLIEFKLKDLASEHEKKWQKRSSWKLAWPHHLSMTVLHSTARNVSLPRGVRTYLSNRWEHFYSAKQLQVSENEMWWVAQNEHCGMCVRLLELLTPLSRYENAELSWCFYMPALLLQLLASIKAGAGTHG